MKLLKELKEFCNKLFFLNYFFSPKLLLVPGQLGTGNKTNFNVPQQIQDLPPVLSVACGHDHTLIITNDSNFGHVEAMIPDNYAWRSAGCLRSLFQNNKGEIFACGFNQYGQWIGLF